MMPIKQNYFSFLVDSAFHVIKIITWLLTVIWATRTPLCILFFSFPPILSIGFRLEREQNELMREQARIRARLAASRPAVSASATRTKPRLSSNSKSTNTPLRSPKLSLNITSTNHFLGSEVARSSGTGLSNAGDGSTPCGPRIRHGPPPKPRDTASARYAY